MKALEVHALSEGLSGARLTRRPIPERARGEVLVAVRAAALNFPDWLMTQGLYQFKPPLPYVAGMELAGEVIEADPDSGFAAGDKVYGGGKTGAFAEFAALGAHQLAPMPEGLSFEQAAALGVAYHTAYTGLVELGHLRAGQSVFVTGASGGVGLATGDLAKALGARVIAGTGAPEKVERIERALRPHGVVVTSGRFREGIAPLTEGALCDLVFDVVGGDVFDEATRCVAFGGKLVIAGFASGRIAQLATNIPLIKGFSIIGLRAGEYARRFPERGQAIRAQIAALAEAGRIAPHIDRVLPLEDWREGFDAMRARKIVGKIILKP